MKAYKQKLIDLEEEVSSIINLIEEHTTVKTGQYTVLTNKLLKQIKSRLLAIDVELQAILF